MASYRLCRGLEDSLLLLAVPATSVETDYGWIEAAAAMPGSTDRSAATGRAVDREAFRRAAPPPCSVAAACGTPWWSRLAPARCGSSAGGCFPTDRDLRRPAASAARGPGSTGSRRTHEARVLHDAYDHLRPADFSADFLARAVDSTLVFPLEDLLWSDWGRPKRVMHSIQELGLQAPGATGSRSAESDARTSDDHAVRRRSQRRVDRGHQIETAPVAHRGVAHLVHDVGAGDPRVEIDQTSEPPQPPQ